MPSTTTVSATGDPTIDGLLSGIGWALGDLTFSFPTSGSFYGGGYGWGEPSSGFEVLNSQQQVATRSALAQFSAVANLAFTETTETADRHGDLRFAESDLPSTAWGYYPTTRAEGGDVWFNRSSGWYNSPVKGNYAYTTFLHEIGHALGLKHPHDADDGFPAMPVYRDSMEYTVMSYRSYVGSSGGGYTNETWGYAQTLMIADIAALQTMYGPNYNTNSGDTLYSWSPTSGEMSINGIGQGAAGGNRIFMSLWDGGGVDTYDFSGYTSGLLVDLGPGGWTRTSSAQLARLHYSGSQIAAGNIANALLYDGDTRSLIENATGGAGDDTITGNTAANVLKGGGGDDRISGSAGDDLIDGGSGIDTAVFSGARADYAITKLSDGSLRLTDLRSAGPDGMDTLMNVEVLVFSDGSYDASQVVPPKTQEGSASDDVFIVDDAADEVYEAIGEGFDEVRASVSYALGAGQEIEKLTLTGSADINGTGNEFANTLVGNAGLNVLQGLGGNDTYIVQNTGDQVVEAAGAGFDEVRSSVTFALGDGQEIEKLVLTGSADIDGTGNEFSNSLVGNAGRNMLAGFGGDDTYVVQNETDEVLEALGGGSDQVRSSVSFALGAGQEIEKLVLTGSANINGTGNEFANVLLGNAGLNVLAGLGGDDCYIVQNSGDQVVEAIGGGKDQVRSSVSFVLATDQEIEKLVLTGTGNIDGTGNEFSNIFLGNTGRNVFTGLAGDDTYVVQNADDRVIEAAGGGYDLVESSVSFALEAGQEIEKLRLTGTADINATGNGFSNILVGNAGINVLTGLGGDDTYEISDARDQVIEAIGGGRDLVVSSVSYSLAAGQEIEKLVLTGSGNLDAIGNEFANILVGNAGVNVLAGLAGDDSYEIYNAADQVLEAAGGGKDLVVSHVSWAMGAGQEIEKLVLAGSADLDATGNEFANILVGNSGVNVLAGMGGDDTYEIYNSADEVLEAAGGGKDLVVSYVSWVMSDGQEIEKARLAGSGDLDLTGNSFDNSLVGNTGANRIEGGGGRDYMFAGVDDAQDVFVFRDPADSGATSGTADRIYEFRTADGAASGTSDLLDVSLLDADPADGDQAFRFVSDFTAAASGEPLGQIMLQQNDGWTDVLVDLDGDNSVDMMVQVHSSGTLTGADFLL